MSNSVGKESAESTGYDGSGKEQIESPLEFVALIEPDGLSASSDLGSLV
jgi:hypothetical protein